MTKRTPGEAAHVIRLGTPAAAQHAYMREHADGEVSWTSTAKLAIAFLTADAAKRYAARRLGGAWHVAAVDRAGHRRLVIGEEFDAYPAMVADAAAASSRPTPESTLIPRAQGLALAARRRANRAAVSTLRRA